MGNPIETYYLKHIPGNRTALLGMKTKDWAGGLLSLTYLGDIDSKELRHLANCSVAEYGACQGTGEMVLLMVHKTFIPTKLCAHLEGSVGILEVKSLAPYDLVALLIDSTPLQGKGDTYAVYWIHFNFE